MDILYCLCIPMGVTYYEDYIHNIPLRCLPLPPQPHSYFMELSLFLAQKVWLFKPVDAAPSADK